jgi:hypothetical protein
MLSRAILEFHGTTGWDLAKLLRTRVQNNFGDWLPLWQVLVTETVDFAPTDFPPGWFFAPVAAPLADLYHYRDRPALPRWVVQTPQSVWVNLQRGAQKLPVAAAISFALHRDELNRWRQGAWSFVNDPTSLMVALGDQRHPLSPEQVFVILVGAAGGSTGHAGILSAIDFWVTHPSHPLVMVFLIGPNAGSSQDDFRTERANAYRLFRSLADRQQVWGQVWIFWVDGFPNQRQRLLHEVAEFLLLLIARPEGEELRRSLCNGFAIAQRRYGASICRLDIFRLRAPSDEFRRWVALSVLLSALRDLTEGIGLSNQMGHNNSMPPEVRRLLRELDACLLPLDALNEALRAGGSLEHAAQIVVATTRANLEERRGQILRAFEDSLQNRSQNLNLRGFWGYLEGLSRALEEQIEECLHEDIERELEESEKKLSASELVGYGQLAASLRRKIVELMVRRELLGDKIEVIKNAIEILRQWEHKAVGAIKFLTTMATRTQELLQQLPRFEVDDFTRFNFDPELLFHLVKENLSKYINAPNLDDPDGFIERVSAELKNFVPSIAFSTWFSSSEVANFLRQLPIWAGVKDAARYVFQLPEPFIVAEVPQIQLPPETRFSEVFKNSDGSSLVVRVFKHIPLEAIDGWENWQEADEEIRRLYYGGFVANSAEPFKWEGEEGEPQKPMELGFKGF